MAKKYYVKNHFWIEVDGMPFLGYGRVLLLQNIKKHGSISAAARVLNMAYRKAWNLVESMNTQAENPLVVRISGGKGGGGTTLTVAGEKAVEKFHALNSKSDEFLNNELGKIKF